MGAGRGRGIALQTLSNKGTPSTVTTRYHNGTRNCAVISNNPRITVSCNSSVHSFNPSTINPLAESINLSKGVVQAQITNLNTAGLGSVNFIQDQQTRQQPDLYQQKRSGQDSNTSKQILSTPRHIKENETDEIQDDIVCGQTEIVITNNLNLELGLNKSDDTIDNDLSAIASTADTPVDESSLDEPPSPPFMDDDPSIDQIYSPLILDGNVSSQQMFPSLVDDPLLDFTKNSEAK